MMRREKISDAETSTRMIFGFQEFDFEFQRLDFGFQWYGLIAMTSSPSIGPVTVRPGYRPAYCSAYAGNSLWAPDGQIGAFGRKPVYPRYQKFFSS
jgi:hypothetical protein